MWNACVRNWEIDAPSKRLTVQFTLDINRYNFQIGNGKATSVNDTILFPFQRWGF